MLCRSEAQVFVLSGSAVSYSIVIGRSLRDVVLDFVHGEDGGAARHRVELVCDLNILHDSIPAVRSDGHLEDLSHTDNRGQKHVVCQRDIHPDLVGAHLRGISRRNRDCAATQGHN